MKRLLTALVLTPFFFYTVVYAPDWLFLVSLAAVGVLAYYEFLGISQAHYPAMEADQRRNLLGYIAGVFLLVMPNREAMWLTLAALFIWTALLRSKSLWPILPAASAAVFGVLYIFGALRCAVGLRTMDPWWLMFALAINWVGDSFAYYCGRAFGRNKLAPSISPGKTWEGTIASLAGTAALFFSPLPEPELRPRGRPKKTSDS